MKGIAFKDRVFARVQAGDGGNGCCSFRREKYVPKGGPDGGDGGRGGSIHLKASKDVDSLVSLYYQPLQRAQSGGPGSGAQKTGEHGKDLVIPVPCGTTVWEIPTPEPRFDFVDEDEERPEKAGVFEVDRTYLGEVVRSGDTLLVAKGGTGGKGNQHFATPSHQAPREFTEGTKGESRTLILELKSVADVGLVGYPNAGKSTLLAALTNAKPRIAAYPFTTINPIIGTLALDDYTSLRIADIPGLIKDAHKGVGLGHDFLRHIERSGFLLVLIDMAGSDGRNPVDDYRSLKRELKLYSEELVTRPSLVVANKMDEPAAAAYLKEFKRRTKIAPLPISAALGEGVPELKEALLEWKRGLRSFEPNP
jgi:GTP-binding protein